MHEPEPGVRRGPFAQLQALPKDGKAVVSWANPDDAYTEIPRAIRILACEQHADSVVARSQRATGSRELVGPELVIDYKYAEDRRDCHDANAPLVIKNISQTEQAYNISVLPLQAGEGVLDFEPELIPYIEAAGSKNVFAWIKKGSPLFRRRLPDFLFTTYKDESVEELFGIKTFTLCIRYEGAGSTRFEISCELLFRPWKKEVSVGRIERRAISPDAR